MKNNKGITLIALVVTIIVLLILAGVSIAMLTGQNGILNKAGEARDNSAAGTLDEAAKIAVGNILTTNLKWPYGTATTTNGVTTYSFGTNEVSTAQTAIETEIKNTNSNITMEDSLAGWEQVSGSTTKYQLTATVDGKPQTVVIDLATGAVSK